MNRQYISKCQKANLKILKPVECLKQQISNFQAKKSK